MTEEMQFGPQEKPEAQPYIFPAPKYRRLLRIAALANAVAWIVLVGYVVILVMRILNDAAGYPLATPYDGYAEFWDTFKTVPLIALRYIFSWLELPLQGLVSFTVLKGIALGLKMIVETDKNRSGQGAEVKHA